MHRELKVGDGAVNGVDVGPMISKAALDRAVDIVNKSEQRSVCVSSHHLPVTYIILSLYVCMYLFLCTYIYVCIYEYICICRHQVGPLISKASLDRAVDIVNKSE